MFIIFLHISYSSFDTIKHTHQRVLYQWGLYSYTNVLCPSSPPVLAVCVQALLLSFRSIRLFESTRHPWQAQHVSIEAVRERHPCSMLRPLESSWMMLFNVKRSPTTKAAVGTSVDQEWHHWKMSSCSPRAMKFHAPALNSTSSEKFDQDIKHDDVVRARWWCQIAQSRDPKLPSEAPYSNDEEDDN